MFRLRFMAPLLVIGVFGSGFLMGDDKKEPIVVRVSLPRYYSQLGLTPKQRNEIYKIRGKYTAEIQELYDKISELREKDKEDCEKVLTKAQHARYRELLGGPDRRRNADEDDDLPIKTDKKKGTATKDKKSTAEPKVKKAPGEINKPVDIKK